MKNKFDWFLEYVLIHGIVDKVNAYLREKHKDELRKIRKEAYNEYVLFRLMIEKLTDEEMEEIMKWKNY